MRNQSPNLIRIILKGFGLLLGSLFLLFVLGFLRIFGIFYQRPIENIPFDNPVTILSIEGRTMLLTDGRKVILPGDADDTIRKQIEYSGNIVGLEQRPWGTYAIEARGYRTICGLGSPIFTLPIIPVDVPRYTKKEIMWECTIEVPEEQVIKKQIQYNRDLWILPLPPIMHAKIERRGVL